MLKRIVDWGSRRCHICGSPRKLRRVRSGQDTKWKCVNSLACLETAYSK